MVTYTCHPNYVGKHKQKDGGPGWLEYKVRTYLKNKQQKKGLGAGRRPLTPIILATQEAEIRRIAIRRQPGQTVPQEPILKKTLTKKGWCRP
jgi:hypothetical protein